MLRTDLGDGVRLRRFTAGDADELHALIEANRDRLRPWMPWADQDHDGTRAYLRDVNSDPREVQCAITRDGRLVGAIGIVSRATRAGSATKYAAHFSDARSSRSSFSSAAFCSARSTSPRTAYSPFGVK